jgi:hypothetical protein
LDVDHSRRLPGEPPVVRTTNDKRNSIHDGLTVQQAHALVFLDSFPSSASAQGRRFLGVGRGDGFVDVTAKKRDSGRWNKAALQRDDLGRPPLVAQHQIPFTRSLADVTNGDFDVVSYHHVLEHIEAPIEFLRALRAQISPTGWLWITMPNIANAVYSAGHVHNYLAPSLADMAGFGSAALKVWAQAGQLRTRVPREGPTGYPPPMEQALRATGRCPAEALARWRWEPDHR